MVTLSKINREAGDSRNRASYGILLCFIVLLAVRENQSEESIDIATQLLSGLETSTEKVPVISPCLYAEEDLCRTLPTSLDPQAPCQCQSHPTIPNFLVCCNITDVSRVVACASNPSTKEINATLWHNVHIRNATFNELDVSHNAWKLLRSLSITDGNIKKITNEFTKFSMPKCLNVSNNNLTEIFPRAFTNLTQLLALDMSFNNLSRIPHLSVQTNLTVNIKGNTGVLCASVLESIERSGLKYLEPDSTSCLMNQSYSWFNSTETVPLTQLLNMKQLRLECPNIPGRGSCICGKEQMAFELQGSEGHLMFRAKVDCSGLGLTELPKQLPANTVFLNVSNNNITTISNYFQDVPSYFEVRRFYADNNQISKMDEFEGSIFIKAFEALDLRKNNIDKIPDYLLSNYILDSKPDARILQLGGNKLICDCNSAKVLRMWLIARHNNIPDYDQILCRNMPQKVYELSEVKLCQSQHDWTDYIYYLIASEVILLMALVLKVSYDYWVFKSAGYLPWPASKMPKLPCDWLCES